MPLEKMNVLLSTFQRAASYAPPASKCSTRLSNSRCWTFLRNRTSTLLAFCPATSSQASTIPMGSNVSANDNRGSQRCDTALVGKVSTRTVTSR